MTGDSASVADCHQLLERLEAATERMVALEDEVRILRKRVDGADVAAIHLGVRHIAEALLRHAVRAEGAEVAPGADGVLGRLNQALMQKARDRVDPSFWRYVEALQRTVNANTHYQGDDVYRAAVLRRHDPWDEIAQVLRAVKCIAEEFALHWEPPAGAAPRAPAPRERTHQVAPPARSTRNGQGYADITVADARERDDVRAWLVEKSGLQARGVTRRMNDRHGATKLLNVFPEAFDGGRPTGPSAPKRDDSLDYEDIGNFTVKQARELELGPDIAILTGRSLASVNRKLRDLHGANLVRRQFEWYEPAAIGELTVRTALDYEMESLLARVFGKTRSFVSTELLAAPGQKKLRNVFPKLVE